LKKVLIFLGIMIVLFIALALLTNMGNSKKVSENNPYEKDSLHPATIDLLNDENYQNIILPENLEKKLANQEDATVYFFASDCPFCKEATPMLTPMSEELGIDLVQYNLLEFKQGWNDYNIESTPTIVQFKDGEEVARIVGLQEEDVYRRWLTDNHVQ
jgi:thiol-disulfide isomerase/thioredoxin